MGLEADKETEPYEWWTSFTILMADDDPDHCKVAKEALEENRLAIDLRFVEDGEDRMRSETDVESRPVRVLLVDDDEDDFIITQDLLSEIKGGKFDLKWVATYQAALETMGRHQHDVYLIDYRLGEYNGLELLREVKC
jgi:CheY-like chemotaxis protein